jgi:hypothetical protein
VLYIPVATKTTASDNFVNDRETEVVCDEINALSVDGSPSAAGATEFVQEACAAVDVLGKHYVKSSLLAVQPDIQGLKEYFARPRLVGRGDIVFGTRSRFAVVNVDRTNLFNTLFPNGQIRLTGVYGVRFSLCFKLQIACTPFHQGLLAMGWQYGSMSTNTSVYQRGSKSETVTNLPHVRLDMSELTMAELKVPFLHPLEFLALDQNDEYGSLSLNTIVPVPTATGLVQPSFELYVHIEDLELVGVEPAATFSVTANSGKLVRIEKEVESDARPLSSAAAAQSRALRFIAKGVPMLSSIAGSAAWFVDGVGGALKAWGWAKPTVLDPVLRVAKFSNVAEYNVDEPSPVHVLGPKANNHLTVSGQFSGTDVDEMAMSYVLGCYSQINQPVFSTSLVHGNMIWGMQVSPSRMWFRIPAAGAPYGNLAPPLSIDAAGNAIQPSHVFYLAQMFRQWRGGFRFRFSFAKTKMHGGRVLITYNPGLNYSIDLPTANGQVAGPEINTGLVQPFGYTKIFDLRDGNLVEFDVPYSASFPYLPFGSTIGSISMVVVDPLQAPSMVAQSVGIAVEVCCLPDFELAVPAGIIYPSAPNGTVVSNSGKSVMIAPAETMEQSNSELTVGEKINSIKQLIMIPGQSASLPAATAAELPLLVLPWFSYTNPSATAPAPNNTQVYTNFWYGPHLAACYLYARGGTDVHVYHSGHARTGVRVKWKRNNANAVAVPATTTQISSFRATSGPPYMINNLDSFTHVRFPAYQTTARVPTNIFSGVSYDFKLGGAFTNPVLTQAYYLALGQLVVSHRGGVQVYYQLSRAAADDAMLGHYMGPPPVLVVSSTNNVALDGNLDDPV